MMRQLHITRKTTSLTHLENLEEILVIALQKVFAQPASIPLRSIPCGLRGFAKR
jgi:hypothetical protein